MLLLSVSAMPLFLDTIPGIDPDPLDPGGFPGDEPDFDPEPEPDPDPISPGIGTPGIDPGFPGTTYPGTPLTA